MTTASHRSPVAADHSLIILLGWRVDFCRRRRSVLEALSGVLTHGAVASDARWVWLLSASWCGRRGDVRADMLCDPTGRCCGPSRAHVVDTPLGGAIAVKSSAGLCFPSIAGC